MSDAIAVIDYGMGNLRSVQKGFERVGVGAKITGDPGEVASAPAAVLPGVGAFGDAMHELKRTGLDEAVLAVIRAGRPFLGICLGLQLLFERSSESGDHEGLGVFRGVVDRLTTGVKIPHMGWNQIEQTQDLGLFRNVPDRSNFYFVHSYVVKPADSSVVALTTDYGGDFVSGVARDNIFAFQFHPEKSGEIGLSILKEFGAL